MSRAKCDTQCIIGLNVFYSELKYTENDWARFNLWHYPLQMLILVLRVEFLYPKHLWNLTMGLCCTAMVGHWSCQHFLVLCNTYCMQLVILLLCVEFLYPRKIHCGSVLCCIAMFGHCTVILTCRPTCITQCHNVNVTRNIACNKLLQIVHCFHCGLSFTWIVDLFSVFQFGTLLYLFDWNKHEMHHVNIIYE